MKLGRLVNAAWIAILPAVGWSAAPPPNDEATALAEVTVTARKVSERLQDIPLAITAVTDTDLRNSGAESAQTIMAGLPGAVLIDRGPGQSQLSMRGVVDPASQDATSVRPTVGYYIDEAPVGVTNFNPDLKLFDLERIELLRGPQGTLFGRGSLSGTLRVITKQPDARAFAAEAGVMGSSTSRGGTNYGVNGMVNVPVGPELAVRAVAYRRDMAGFVDNTSPSGRRDQNDEATSGGRIALGWAPSESTRVTAGAILQNQDVGGSFLAEQRFGYGAYRQVRGTPEYYRDRFRLYTLKASHLFASGYELVSATSLLDREFAYNRDLSPLIPLFFGIAQNIPLNAPSTDRSFVQELRLTSPGDRPLRGTVGLYYEDDTRRFDQSAPAPNFQSATGIPLGVFGAPGSLFEGRTRIGTRQSAVFGEGTWKVADKLSFTAGVRWFDYRTNSQIEQAGLVNGGVTRDSGRVSDSGVSPKVAISWNVAANSLLYAQAAKGFRVGGVNGFVPPLCARDLTALGLTAALTAFGPDTIWTYEIGSKNTLSGNRVVVNAAAYLSRWNDIQTFRELPTCGFNFRDNAGKAETKGLELEVAGRPLERIDLSLRVSWNRAELTDPAVGLGVPKGGEIPFTPRFNSSASARYSQPLYGNVSGHVQADYTFVGASNSDLRAANSIRQPSRTTINLRMGLSGTSWETSIFADNLTNRTVLTRVDSFFGQLQANVARPRTVGVSARVS